MNNNDKDELFRVENFEKMMKINNEITFKNGDFLINKYGYNMQNKHIISSMEGSLTKSEFKENPKKISHSNSKDYLHKKIEMMIEHSKNKEAYLLRKVERKIIKLKLK